MVRITLRISGGESKKGIELGPDGDDDRLLSGRFSDLPLSRAMALAGPGGDRPSRLQFRRQD